MAQESPVKYINVLHLGLLSRNAHDDLGSSFSSSYCNQCLGCPHCVLGAVDVAILTELHMVSEKLRFHC